MPKNKSSDEIKQAVKEHYSKAIKLKVEHPHNSCCSSGLVEFDRDAAERFVKLAGYSPDQLAGMPETVSSFGCGNPVAMMHVKPGQTVLDLGSGSGLDLILAAKKVGPEGKVIGLDMTDDMIEICRKNLVTAGIKNAEVRKGEMEKMPVVDNTIDWIISNCVINLSPDKKRVFSEAFRVLKPGGEVMFSDIVTIDLPDELRDNMNAWVGCIAGALDEARLLEIMSETGFTEIKIIDRIIYEGEALAVLTSDGGCCGDKVNNKPPLQAHEKYSGKIASILVNGRKP